MKILAMLGTILLFTGCIYGDSSVSKEKIRVSGDLPTPNPATNNKPFTHSLKKVIEKGSFRERRIDDGIDATLSLEQSNLIDIYFHDYYDYRLNKGENWQATIDFLNDKGITISLGVKPPTLTLHFPEGHPDYDKIEIDTSKNDYLSIGRIYLSIGGIKVDSDKLSIGVVSSINYFQQEYGTRATASITHEYFQTDSDGVIQYHRVRVLGADRFNSRKSLVPDIIYLDERYD